MRDHVLEDDAALTLLLDLEHRGVELELDGSDVLLGPAVGGDACRPRQRAAPQGRAHSVGPDRRRGRPGAAGGVQGAEAVNGPRPDPRLPVRRRRVFRVWHAVAGPHPLRPVLAVRAGAPPGLEPHHCHHGLPTRGGTSCRVPKYILILIRSVGRLRTSHTTTTRVQPRTRRDHDESLNPTQRVP